MTDDLQTPESGQEQASLEIPIPKLEGASAGSSTSAVDTEALLDGLMKRLDPILDKKLQSVKDKRIARLEKQAGLDVSELEELGVKITPEMKTELRFRQLEQERSTPTSPQVQTSSPGNGDALTAQSVQETIKKLNLDANDAEVLEKLRGTYRNPDHFENTMAQLALSRANKLPPSPAASTSLKAAPASSMSQADAETKYGELRTLYKNRTQNAPKIAALQKELITAGLPIE